MFRQSEIYPKNNPRVTKSLVNYGWTQMEYSFNERLKEKLNAAGLKPAELSRRSGVSKQNISRLLNNTPHPITNAPPTTEKETVEKLARALNWDLDNALVSAGFAPSDNNQSDEIVTINFDFEGIPEKEIEKVDHLKDLLEDQIRKIEKLKKEGLE